LHDLHHLSDNRLVTPSPQPIRASKSLKLSLILPFVALIALLTSALGMLWYWTGSNTVSALSEQVMEEKAERIALIVDRHLSRPAPCWRLRSQRPARSCRYPRTYSRPDLPAVGGDLAAYPAQ
jgi:hypothetical protein